MKKIAASYLIIFGIILLIPLTFAIFTSGSPARDEKLQGSYQPPVSTGMGGSSYVAEEILIPVMRTQTSVKEEIPLETYVHGVVAAEMFPTFEPAALQAQAIAARTYALRLLEGEDFLLDTVDHQVFKDEEQLRKRWGSDFERHNEGIRQAVEATEGLVLTHEGNLIVPFFFAMSNGRTENSEDYFSTAYPYLRSVASEWDEAAPNFEVKTPFTLDELRQEFSDSTLKVGNFRIQGRTVGGNVTEVQVGSLSLTGRQFRYRLGLRSADFRFEIGDNILYVVTRGNGHGVGMSQHGANFMALEGKSFADILHHYYQNIEIVQKTSLR